MGRVQKLPYGKSFIELDMDKLGNVQLIEPNCVVNEQDEEAIVREALEHPMGSLSLKELTKGAKKILIITNDNTRPMPSKVTIPAISKSFYCDERYYDITILIANGLHREMREEEMREQFGEEICSKYRIMNHNASDRTQLVNLGRLSSGNILWLNRLLTEHDLIISEGFIEPHFFAGYSGGRKSILPGVAGEETILHNHRPENIASPYAAGATLDRNPIHQECQEAAKVANLAFILNVALDCNKKIVGAFAGDPVKAHAYGCEYVKRMMSVPAKRTDIVITTYERIVDQSVPIHRINLTFNHVVDERYQQYDLFTDPAELEREHKMQEAMLNIKEKYGKNAILKGMNLQEGATAMERNRQIGGHKSGI